MKRSSQQVKEFTEQSSGKVLPTHPVKMERPSVEFLVKHMSSELMELLVTVLDDNEDARDVLKRLIDSADYPTFKKTGKSDEEIMAEQADALVDVSYYGMNGAAKAGYNLDEAFDVVHSANMNKRSKEDGLFHRNEDGKVIKPVGWKEPEMIPLVNLWRKEGTWTPREKI